MEVFKVAYKLDIRDEYGNEAYVRTFFGLFLKKPKVYFTWLNSNQDVFDYTKNIIKRDFDNDIKTINIYISKKLVEVVLKRVINPKTPLYKVKPRKQYD